MDDKKMKESLERMKKRCEERAKEDLETPVEWPPPERVIEKWNYRDLDCATVRNTVGAMCGYVRVPEGHPDDRKGYDDVDVDVHGGLTFRCKAKEGGSWFGFDCAHAGDYIRGLSDELIINKPHHINYDKVWYPQDVKEETNHLAEQLSERSRTS